SPTHVSSTSSAALSVASPLSESGRSSGSQASPTTSQQRYPPGVTQSVSDHETYGSFSSLHSTNISYTRISGTHRLQTLLHRVRCLLYQRTHRGRALRQLPFPSLPGPPAPPRRPHPPLRPACLSGPNRTPWRGLTVIVAVVLAIILVIRLRRRRRDRRDTNVKARMLSPFVHLMSGTPVGGPKSQLILPVRACSISRKKFARRGGGLSKLMLVRGWRNSLWKLPLSRERGHGGEFKQWPGTTEPDGEVALRARISELEAQIARRVGIGPFG
ncbi:hypothetical protein B0H13DRAFT_2063544, partial [Mycena leptocephala]